MSRSGSTSGHNPRQNKLALANDRDRSFDPRLNRSTALPYATFTFTISLYIYQGLYDPSFSPLLPTQWIRFLLSIARTVLPPHLVFFISAIPYFPRFGAAFIGVVLAAV